MIVRLSILFLWIFVKSCTKLLSMTDAYDALHAYFVDTLVDLADPDSEDEHDVREDMRQVINIIFEGLSLDVGEVTSDSATFTVRF